MLIAQQQKIELKKLVPYLFSSKLVFVTLFCVLVLPIFDSMTGAFFKLKIMGEGGLATPSQLGRLLILGLLFFFVFSSEKVPTQIKKRILYLTTFFLIAESLVAILHMGLMPYISGIVFFSKILFCILAYVFFKSWVIEELVYYDLFFRLVIAYGVVVAFLLSSAFISGFHISNYGSKFATRGLFVSGNGVGVTIGTCTLLALYYSFITKQKLFYFLGVFMIFSTVIIGTKTALLFALLSSILFFIISLKFFPCSSLILSILIGIYVVPVVIDALSLVFENIINKFNMIEDKTVLLSSSRDVFIYNAFYKVDWNGCFSVRLLFGGGAYFAYEDLTFLSEVKRKTLENDFFELFFSYGVVAAFTYLILGVTTIVNGALKGRYFLTFCFFLVFLHSVLAGHVLFNGTSSIILVFLLLLINARYHPIKIRSLKS
ncbi:O-antigen polymerase [Pseudoalteromonas rhizosphaerae]|uniref:O-antigen polymerase n=1 Tax=Pseudoalteromonas rhizosphaerae TaxID=2518973 RepID=UPI002147C6AD|nr:O-antigen polymerase [Pseudoalteromonas rhizosphaerae]